MNVSGEHIPEFSKLLLGLRYWFTTFRHYPNYGLWFPKTDHERDKIQFSIGQVHKEQVSIADLILQFCPIEQL